MHGERALARRVVGIVLHDEGVSHLEHLGQKGRATKGRRERPDHSAEEGLAYTLTEGRGQAAQRKVLGGVFAMTRAVPATARARRDRRGQPYRLTLVPAQHVARLPHRFA